jgi:hypothetical protein
MGRVKPTTNSANAGKRFMDVVYACCCIGVAAYGKIVISISAKLITAPSSIGASVS